MLGFTLRSATLAMAFASAIALGLATCSSRPPTAPEPVRWAADSATVLLAAGPQYSRGAGWRFFLGTHYRALWATPVTVPVLRLATAEPGGLAPMRAGGNYQSHTLRLEAASGREFVLRSVDKDLGAALAPGFWRTLMGTLLKDQTSITQPYGAYVAAQLAEAAGVYHANPRLVYLPNDPRLGPYRAEFGQALYLLEERPDGDQSARANFGHSPSVVSSRHMLADIRRGPMLPAGARAYLRARLLDIWLGDWSRREDQWRWASFTGLGGTSYRPIPRDRDQAFFLFDDGVLPRLVSWFVPKYQSFHGHIRLGNVDGLTRTARALDRTLLGGLSADDFRREADSLRVRLSDTAINQAFEAGPAETRATIAARLVPLLRARREEMPAVAQRYYEVLAEEAWVVGTDAAERFIIAATGPGRLRVRVLARRANRADSLLTDQIYNRADTHQLNLYGLGGDDLFEFQPPLNKGIPVSIYDGTGHDQALRTNSSSADFSDFTWYGNPDGDARRNQAGVPVEPDSRPALTANAAGWLGHYNFSD